MRAQVIATGYFKVASDQGWLIGSRAGPESNTELLV